MDWKYISKFNLPYTATGNSSQGDTYDDDITICDASGVRSLLTPLSGVHSLLTPHSSERIPLSSHSSERCPLDLLSILSHLISIVFSSQSELVSASATQEQVHQPCLGLSRCPNPECKVLWNRDDNAARNILKAFLWECLLGVRPKHLRRPWRLPST